MAQPLPLDPNILSAIRARRPTPQPTNPAAPAGANPLGAILTNPGVYQAGLTRDKTLADANAALREQRSQALINFGSPQLAQGLGDTVDQNTVSAAGANPYSTLARLGHADELAGRQILNSLAGRGILASGDLGYKQGEQARSYGQATYDATQQLLAQLNQYLGGYLGTTRSAQDQYTQAILQAFAQMGQNPLGLIW